MKYSPPFAPGWPNVPDPDAPYVNGNRAAGLAGSIPPAQAIEYPQREIVHMIAKGGFIPSDDDLFQLTRAARGQLYSWGVDTGSENSLTIQLDPPLQGYTEGLEVRVLVAHTNTGASTIRINNLSTVHIIRRDGTQVMAGDLREGGIAILVYDGTYFQLVSGAGSVTVGGAGWWNGADYLVDIGSKNQIRGTPVLPIAAYESGQSFVILVKERNDGPVTITVLDAVGQPLTAPPLWPTGMIPLWLPTGQQLAIGDLTPGMLIRVTFVDGVGFTMLSPIDMQFIVQTVDMTVGPNAGAHFEDLHQALEWASRRRFGERGFLNLRLQHSATAGSPVVHNYNRPIVFDHPEGAHITITGGPMNFIPGTGHFSTSAGAGQMAATVTEATGHVNNLRQAFTTELRFAAGVSFIFEQSHCGMLRNLLIVGSGMYPTGTVYSVGINAMSGAFVNFDTVACCLFSQNCWRVSYTSHVVGKNFYAVGCGEYQAVVVSHGSSLICEDANFWIVNSLGTGVWLVFSGSLQTFQPATGPVRYPRVWGCQGHGIHQGQACSTLMSYLWLDRCWGVAISAAQSTVWVPMGYAANCGGGYVAGQVTAFDCHTCSTANITGSSGYGDYTAGQGSTMYAPGFGNSAAQFWPPRNTVGNGNAIIIA